MHEGSCSEGVTSGGSEMTSQGVGVAGPLTAVRGYVRLRPPGRGSRVVLAAALRGEGTKIVADGVGGAAAVGKGGDDEVGAVHIIASGEDARA